MTIEDELKRIADALEARNELDYLNIPPTTAPDDSTTPANEDIQVDSNGFRINWGFKTVIVELDEDTHVWAFREDNGVGKPLYDAVPNSLMKKGTMVQCRYPSISGDGGFNTWRIWGWKKEDGSMTTDWQNLFIHTQMASVRKKYL